MLLLGVVGVVMSRGESSRGDITHTITAPELAGASRVTVSKVEVEANQRVEEGDVILEVRAGDTTREIESPIDGVVTAIAAGEGQEVAVGADLARVQTGPDFASADHWHTAYGVNVCGNWLPQIGEFQSDFHTHGDGIVHAHPRSTSAAGRNATLRLFFERAGLELTATKLEYSDGQTYRSGEVECGEGDESRDGVLRWALNGEEQEGNPANHVIANGDVVALAFIPEDDEMPTIPPSTSFMVENYTPANHPDVAPPETPPTSTPAETPAEPPVEPPAETPTTASGG